MQRRGVTLLELMAVVTILGLLASMALPGLASARDAAAVRAARSTMLEALDAARGAAIRLGTTVSLSDSAGVLVVSLDSTALWASRELPRRGVVLAGLGSPIRFGPAGLATGASNRTLQLSRGSVTMAVVLSRLGRLRTD